MRKVDGDKICPHYIVGRGSFSTVCCGFPLTVVSLHDIVKKYLEKDIFFSIYFLMEVSTMKKWHLEGVLYRVTPEKLILPAPGQSAIIHSSFLRFHKESKLVSCCRRIAAFFIRFF